MIPRAVAARGPAVPEPPASCPDRLPSPTPRLVGQAGGSSRAPQPGAAVGCCHLSQGGSRHPWLRNVVLRRCQRVGLEFPGEEGQTRPSHLQASVDSQESWPLWLVEQLARLLLSCFSVEFFFFLIFLFIFNYFSRWVSVATHGLPLVAESRGRSPVATCSFVVVSLVAKQQGPAVVVHGLSCPVAQGIFLDQGLNPRTLHR